MSIKREVLKAVNKKIAQAQRECDSEIAGLRAEKSSGLKRAWETLFSEVARIRKMFVIRKAEVEARHVNSILSKII